MRNTSVLFICLGNICRSPLAEGVFRNEVEKLGLSEHFTIDSAGTGGWHIGNPPDPRSIDIARQYSIDISKQSCRRLEAEDFHDFDYIFAMDHSNLANAKSINNNGGSAQLSLFTHYAGQGEIEIPDPYYGGTDGFNTAYLMIKQASIDVLQRLQNQANG